MSSQTAPASRPVNPGRSHSNAELFVLQDCLSLTCSELATCFVVALVTCPRQARRTCCRKPLQRFDHLELHQQTIRLARIGGETDSYSERGLRCCFRGQRRCARRAARSCARSSFAFAASRSLVPCRLQLLLPWFGFSRARSLVASRRSFVAASSSVVSFRDPSAASFAFCASVGTARGVWRPTRSAAALSLSRHPQLAGMRLWRLSAS